MIEDHLSLPAAVPRPCNDCPWRRNAAPGWLGPYSPQEWVEIAHGESPIACHQTIPGPATSWNDPRLRQCKGAAIFRANVFKSPRNPNDAEHDSGRDTTIVFGRDAEFIDHHGPNYWRIYARKS